MNRREVLIGAIAASAVVGISQKAIATTEPVELLNPHQLKALSNYAPMLDAMLKERGVSILPTEFIRGGAKIGVPSLRGALWQQRHVDAKYKELDSRCVEALANSIAAFSFRIRCGQLVLPKSGVIGASYMVHDNIHMRLITSYVPPIYDKDPYADEIISRLDIMFCDANEETK
jgi:hypothetical protein